jgi:hypothetical protein
MRTEMIKEGQPHVEKSGFVVIMFSKVIIRIKQKQRKQSRRKDG